MHQGNALAERGIQDGLAFLDVHLNADRLEPHGVHGICHHVLPLKAASFSLLLLHKKIPGPGEPTPG